MKLLCRLTEGTGKFQRVSAKISAGWQEEFQKQAGRFVDPMDRLRQMQAMREHFAENWQEDWQNLSREEQHLIRHQMQREMRNASREFSRNFNHDFRRNFAAILTAITDQTKRKVQKIQNGTIFNIEGKVVSYK